MRTVSPKPQLDVIDRQILTALQTDGRLSNVQLAEQVHLSPSACLRRVKQLEDAGVIGQYVALLNAKALGQHGTCFSIINLQTMSDGVLKAFEQAVRDEPEVLDCFYVAGSNDYLLRFSYRDAEDLERVHTEVLMRLPGVERSNSMLVLRTVKKTTALPVYTTAHAIGVWPGSKPTARRHAGQCCGASGLGAALAVHHAGQAQVAAGGGTAAQAVQRQGDCERSWTHLGAVIRVNPIVCIADKPPLREIELIRPAGAQFWPTPCARPAACLARRARWGGRRLWH